MYRSVVTLGQPFVGVAGIPGSGVSLNLGILPAIGSGTNVIVPPFRSTILPGFGLTAGGFHFSFLSVAGQNYVMEASTNLIHWAPVWTNQGTGAEMLFSDPEATNYPIRFYRVKEQ